ncbi:type II secretion system protein GspM [Thauera propionica]|uniref:type II secretion system protein GspM n=1 Tax=Thauera propionica TaxID=2019431 RepID=UPI0023EF7C05|nr:type II secretion system protein GspM [Thauera propionica]MDD3676585.1 type II secretion system protein GspM [Thauera propionica]
MSLVQLERFPGRDGRIVVGATLVALAAVLGVLAYLLAAKLAWAQDVLDAIEPRYARLLGLREVRPQLEASLAEIGTTLPRYAYPAELDLGRIGADVQERVRELAEAAGLSVAGSQILPVRAHAGFVQVPLKVTVDGTLEGLRTLLAGLDRGSPAVLVDQLQVNAGVRRARRGQPAQEERLSAQINLSVLRLQP